MAGPGGRLVLALALALVLRSARAAEDVPSIVLFSVDDGLLASSWELVHKRTLLATKALNPNGCRPSATWFTASRAHGRNTADCATVQGARAAGHELASHTLSHSKDGLTFSYKDWVKEAGGMRQWLVDCGVPKREVVGFRAPYFQVSEPLGQVLQDLGFAYDSSLKGRADSTTPGFPLSSSPPAPDCGAFNLNRGACGNWSSLHKLWEIPAYLLPGTGPLVGRRVDPGPSETMTVLERLKADFLRKRGTGIPTSLGVHEPYLEDAANRQAVVAFLRWALQRPNTWAITYRQYLEWRQAPAGTDIAAIVARYPCDK